MNFKVDDEYFKDKINYNNLEDNIYTQFAKTMAKNVDIDLVKTPLVDILTGYTRYRILQSKIDKANEILDTLYVVKPYESVDGEFHKYYRPVKNTTKQEIYKAICDLREILKEDK